MSGREVHVAVIGLGAQALREHIPSLLQSDRVKIVGVCDSNPATVGPLSEVLAKYGASDAPTFFEDPGELLKVTKPEIAICSLPHDQYLRIIELCALNGVSVLKEKPFARNLPEALEFKRISDESGIKIMTTFQRRFHPLYNAFKYVVKSLGEVQYIYGSYHISSKSPNSGWRGRREQCGGGVLLDMGYHFFDMIIWYFDRPDWVRMEAFNCGYGDYDVEDTCFVEFEVQKIPGRLTVSCISPSKIEELVVVGDNGTATLSPTGIIRKNRKQEIMDELQAPKNWHTAMVNQTDYFARVVRKEDPRGEYYSTPLFQIEKHVPTLDACYRSAEIGQRVRVEDMEWKV
jgi:predicted dehydrogenase